MSAGAEVPQALEKEHKLADQVSLSVAERTVLGKQVKQLRRKGIIPANVYGLRQPSQALQVDLYTLERFLAKHHATHVITLQGASNNGGAPVNALVRHIARSPGSGKILHVDFLRISMNEPVTVRVPLVLKGEAPAVKLGGGVLLHLMDTVEVECLPGDLPDALEADVSGLKEMDDTLHLRDVRVPPKVTLLSDPDEPVIKVVAPRAVLAEEAEKAAEREAEKEVEAAPETTEEATS
jgi:large subunit ribosomal protein L25